MEWKQDSEDESNHKERPVVCYVKMEGVPNRVWGLDREVVFMLLFGSEVSLQDLACFNDKTVECTWRDEYECKGFSRQQIMSALMKVVQLNGDQLDREDQQVLNHLELDRGTVLHLFMRDLRSKLLRQYEQGSSKTSVMETVSKILDVLLETIKLYRLNEKNHPALTNVVDEIDDGRNVEQRQQDGRDVKLLSVILENMKMENHKVTERLHAAEERIQRLTKMLHVKLEENMAIANRLEQLEREKKDRQAAKKLKRRAVSQNKKPFVC